MRTIHLLLVFFGVLLPFVLSRDGWDDSHVVSNEGDFWPHPLETTDSRGLDIEHYSNRLEHLARHRFAYRDAVTHVLPYPTGMTKDHVINALVTNANQRRLLHLGTPVNYWDKGYIAAFPIDHPGIRVGSTDFAIISGYPRLPIPGRVNYPRVRVHGLVRMNGVDHRLRNALRYDTGYFSSGVVQEGHVLTPNEFLHEIQLVR